MGNERFKDFPGTESFFSWIRIQAKTIRIRIQFGLDTDPYQIFQVLDPDPYQNDTDPQHWAQLMASIIKCSQLEITQYTIPGEYQYQEED